MDRELIALRQQISACRLCEPHLELGCNPVCQIHGDARILIAGQAPGRKVHDSGIPFNDASGVRLCQWLGIDQTTLRDAARVAIVPMAFCYPGKGSSGDLPPRRECADTWRDTVLGSLGQVRLTLVIGQYAQAWHMRDSRKGSLTDTVRHWRAYGALLPLPHPSPRNQIWLRRNPWFETDLLPDLRQRVAAALN